jgi:epoxide hydrolase-like predicted phosphatase
MKYIGILLSCFCLGMNTSKDQSPLKEPPQVIVFDFGRVVGGSNQKKLAQSLEKELELSQDEANNLVNELKKWKGTDQEFWDAYAKSQGKTLPQNWLEWFEELKRNVIEVNPCVLKIVQELRAAGYRTALLANTTQKRALHMRKLGVFAYFDPVVLSCDIGVNKPAKQAYEIFLKEAQVSASQCLFIDDKQENIDAATNLGFDGILFTSPEDLRRELEKRFLTPSTRG